MNLDRYEKFLNSKKASLELLTKKQDNTVIKIKGLESNLSNLEEALDIMNAVGILAQSESKEVFEKLVTQALQYVFGENYSFEMDSVVSRNQPEIHMYVVIDNNRYLLKDADDDLGFGVVDVCSFVLRLICWAIQYPVTRNCFVIDEPCRNLDKERLILFGDVIRNLSEMFDTQYIITTHKKHLIELADVCYHVEKVDGISVVEKIESV